MGAIEKSPAVSTIKTFYCAHAYDMNTIESVAISNPFVSTISDNQRGRATFTSLGLITERLLDSLQSLTLQIDSYDLPRRLRTWITNPDEFLMADQCW
jgi:hypothetical protein